MDTPPAVDYLSKKDLLTLTNSRPGETKLGEVLSTVEQFEGNCFTSKLQQAHKSGVRYIVMGIPEDIGVRANCGKAGAAKAWPCFLSAFCNIQADTYLKTEELALLGSVSVSELALKASSLKGYTENELKQLRALCAEIDKLVSPVIQSIALAGLEPIVIGGGHNNCFPILDGVSRAFQQLDKKKGLICINMDAHADFRSCEGRHSGNGFSYAFDAEILKHYHVLGLQEAYNSKVMLDQLKSDGFSYTSFSEIALSKNYSFGEIVEERCKELDGTGLPCGIELDMDSASDFPASARTPVGFSLIDCAQYLSITASKLNCSYLHIAEAAPDPDGSEDQKVGKALAFLVGTYICSRSGASFT